MARKFLKNKGFSLIEISIVLVVLGIMLYSGLSLVSAQTDVANIRSTQTKLEKIQTALDLFVATQNRLPCPANGKTLNTAAAFGIEHATVSTSGNGYTCSDPGSDSAGFLTNTTAGARTYTGVVPTRTLNLPDSYMFDAWGRRLTYVVSKYCTAPSGVAAAATSGWAVDATDYYKGVCDSDITVTATSNGVAITGTEDIVNYKAYKAAYIVISHGKNGEGAWSRAGVRVASGNNGTKEYINAEATSTATAIFNDGAINDGDVVAKKFDDIVIWQTPGQIRAAAQ